MTSIFRFWVTTVTVFRLRVLGRRRRLGLSTQLCAETPESVKALLGVMAIEADALFHELDGAADVFLTLENKTCEWLSKKWKILPQCESLGA